jgi:hypothetical protein
MFQVWTHRGQWLSLLVLVGVVWAAGCSQSKDFSDEDWNRVKLGMSLEEVEKILGKGEKIQQSEYTNFPGHVQADTFRRWKSGNKTSWAAFQNDKLVAKQQTKQGG